MTAWGWTVSNKAADWYVVNDTVMGGVSSSEVFNSDAGSLVFSGLLSTENNGGFTSTRTEAFPTLNGGLQKLTLKLRGDGRTYIATIRTPYPSLRRIYYRQAFETVANTEIEVELYAKDFKPYTFGRRVPSAPSLDEIGPGIGSIGFMLADKNPGSFALEIITLEGTSQERDDDLSTPQSLRDFLSLAITRGVPLFNSGQPGRCADIYQSALSTILLGDFGLTDAQRDETSQALKIALSEPSIIERAWILRRAIDRLIT